MAMDCLFVCRLGWLYFQIKHFLFRRNMPFGSDLRAIDIQRNRDHALASYNDFRQFCGLRRAQRWEDYDDLIDSQVRLTHNDDKFKFETDKKTLSFSRFARRS